jgi:hypothetical protein
VPPVWVVNDAAAGLPSDAGRSAARAAHLDVGGARGQAIRQALHDQLGLVVDAVEPFGLTGSAGSTPLRIKVKGEGRRTRHVAVRQAVCPQEISEGFAAARGLALPTQLRKMLHERHRDLLAEFLQLLPAPPRPIRIQRWSPRRIGLLLLVLPLAALFVLGFRWVLLSDSQTTTHLLISRLDCDRPEPLWLQAQAVPSASLVPCAELLPGWTVADVNARNGWSGFMLDHDRAGRDALVVRLTSACDPAGATHMPSTYPGVQHCQRTTRRTGSFTEIWYDRFPVGV